MERNLMGKVIWDMAKRMPPGDLIELTKKGKKQVLGVVKKLNHTKRGRAVVALSKKIGRRAKRGSVKPLSSKESKLLKKAKLSQKQLTYLTFYGLFTG
jgi:predicted ribonuclease YlaK